MPVQPAQAKMYLATMTKLHSDSVPKVYIVLSVTVSYIIACMHSDIQDRKVRQQPIAPEQAMLPRLAPVTYHGLNVCWCQHGQVYKLLFHTQT